MDIKTKFSRAICTATRKMGRRPDRAYLDEKDFNDLRVYDDIDPSTNSDYYTF